MDFTPKKLEEKKEKEKKIFFFSKSAVSPVKRKSAVSPTKPAKTRPAAVGRGRKKPVPVVNSSGTEKLKLKLSS